MDNKNREFLKKIKTIGISTPSTREKSKRGNGALQEKAGAGTGEMVDALRQFSEGLDEQNITHLGEEITFIEGQMNEPEVKERMKDPRFQQAVGAQDGDHLKSMVETHLRTQDEKMKKLEKEPSHSTDENQVKVVGQAGSGRQEFEKMKARGDFKKGGKYEPGKKS